MGSVQLELVQNGFWRTADDIMYLVHLVQFVSSWKQWKECKYLKKHTPNPPDVHFLVLVTVGQQTFRRPVPTCTYLLGERGVRENASTRPEVCQFQSVLDQQNIFWFNVSVEYTLLVHMVDTVQ